MTPDDRQSLRGAATAAMAATPPRTSVERVLARWSLQTSNSFRRIGCHGDGDVLCATVHPDQQPDLLAAPGVLDYIVAAQPRIVLEMLDMLDEAERVLTTKLDEIECEWAKRLDTVQSSLDEVLATVETLKKACLSG